MARVQRERDRFVGFVLGRRRGDSRSGQASRPRALRRRPHARGRRRSARRMRAGDRHRDRLVARVSRRVRERSGDRLVINDDVFDWTDAARSRWRCSARASSASSSARRCIGSACASQVFGRGGGVGPLQRPGAARRSAPRVRRRVRSRHRRARRASLEREGDAWPSATARSTARRAPSISTTCWPPPAARRTSHGLGLEHTSVRLRRARRAAVRPRDDAMRDRRRSSSPAMPTTTFRCCTRRPTKAASRATTPRAFPTCDAGLRRSPLSRRVHRSADRHRRRRLARRACTARIVTGRGVVRRPGPRARDAAQPRACCTSTPRSRTGLLPRRGDDRSRCRAPRPPARVVAPARA